MIYSAINKFMKRKRDILIGALKKGADMAVVGGDKLIVAATPHAEALVSKGREAINPSPISPENWYRKAADACEDISDIFLPNGNRIQGRAQNIISAKLGGVGAAAGIYSLAGMVGTASTGTAIGSLSGAAATSATLAWLGGSVFVGGLLVGGATIVGGLGAVKAIQIAKDRLYAKKMALDELGPDEAVIVNACVPLAIAFRQQDVSGQALDSCSARAIRDDVMAPLQAVLNEYKFDHQNLPYLTQCKLHDSTVRIVDLYNYLHHWVKRNPGIGTGIVSAVFVQLLAEIVPDFSADEIVVLEALRRSSNALNDATVDE